MKTRTAVPNIHGAQLDPQMVELRCCINAVGAIQIALDSEEEDFYSDSLTAVYRYMTIVFKELENLVYREIEVPENENQNNVHSSGKSPI